MRMSIAVGAAVGLALAGANLAAAQDYSANGLTGDVSEFVSRVLEHDTAEMFCTAKRAVDLAACEQTQHQAKDRVIAMIDPVALERLRTTGHLGELARNAVSLKLNGCVMTAIDPKGGPDYTAVIDCVAHG